MACSPEASISGPAASVTAGPGGELVGAADSGTADSVDVAAYLDNRTAAG